MGATYSRVPWWEEQDVMMSPEQKSRIQTTNAQWPHGTEGGTYDDIGISPDVFGPFIWDTLSLIARNYPVSGQVTQEHIDTHHQYLLLTCKILPCSTCREHSHTALIDIGYDPQIHLQDRQSFSRFINTLHNHVNKSIGKKEFTFENHRDKYNDMINVSASCSF